jgi:hypothetical protein
MSFQDLFHGRTNQVDNTKRIHVTATRTNQKHLGSDGVKLKQPNIGTKQKIVKGGIGLPTIPSGGTFTGDTNDTKGPLHECNRNNLNNATVSFASDVSMMDQSVASNTSKSSTTGGSRSSLRRRKKKVKSVFSILMSETQQFQKVVSELETFLIINPKSRDAVGECPEATWKARILLRSAQDADEDLRSKLEVYEKTLSSLTLLGIDKQHAKQQQQQHVDDYHITPKEIQLAQMSCQKLRRDFDRSHKILFSCLAQYEKRQHAEIKQLRAVDWGGSKKGNYPTSNNNNTNNNSTTNEKVSSSDNNKFEDFFDQAMRQRDLERLQASMEQVSTIYKELAGLVTVQQEQIDKLESDVENAATNVDKGNKSFRGMNPFSACGEIIPTSTATTSSTTGCYDNNNKEKSIHSSYMIPGCGALSSVIHDNDFVSSGTNLQRFDSKITFTDTPRKKQDNVGWLLESNNRGLQDNIKEEIEVVADNDNDDDNESDNIVADEDLLEFIRISEGFHWMMPFETIREDFVSVRNDILSVGKGVVESARQVTGRGLECSTSTPKS